MGTKRKTTVIRKKVPFKDLTDAQRYDIMRMYRLGTTVIDIADKFSVEEAYIKVFINEEINALNTIKETNSLVSEARGLSLSAINPTKLLNEKFLQNVDDKKEAYAFYYAMTGSNEHALKEAGLDKWLPAKVAANTKRYVFQVRGKYLRSLPGISEYIIQVREDRLKELKLDKKTIQNELLDQLEQLKEEGDPRQRSNLLKAIDMLGKTVGAFEERIKVEDVSAKSGLELLMEKARAEAITVEDSYTIEDA